jgi:hypothetical protein
MTLRDLLLRAYPRSWRDEYGEEFADVLAQERLTVSVLADVLGNGARQRLLRDEPWKICGAGLLLWTCLGLVLITDSRLAPHVQSWSGNALGCFSLATGAWTVLRKKPGFWEPGAAAVKAAMVGISPGMLATLLWGPVVVRYADGTTWQVFGLYTSASGVWGPGTGRLLRHFIVTCSLIELAESAVMGLTGAAFCRFICGPTRRSARNAMTLRRLSTV